MKLGIASTDQQSITRSEASRFGSEGEMASAGGESSENNQGTLPNEDKRTEYQDTEAIVMHFMVQPHQGETQRVEEHGEMESPSASARSDALEELRAGNAPISRDEQEVVDILTKMADELNTKYRKKIRDMTDALSLTPGTAYESFAAVARGLFRTGIDWGRVIALLCFGHEIAMRVMQGHFGDGFLLRIIRFVVDFIFREQIARWIAENGGWRAVMDFRLSEPSWYTVGIVLLLGTMAVFLASRKK